MYVGKAKNLRRRVSSYFHKTRKRRYIRNMINRIRDIEVLIVNNETESLILENNLIKRYRPDTNRALMDDRTGYPYIVRTNEPLPRFVPFRKNRVNRDLGQAGVDGAGQRFGPYLNTRFRDTLLDFIGEYYQIRTCNPMPKSVCLSYHLGICGGICEGKISQQAYLDVVKEATTFLSHNHIRMARQMRKRMNELADDLKFEKARKVRDQLIVIEQALESQIVERDVAHNQSVIWFGEEHGLIMHIECGMLWGMELFRLDQRPSICLQSPVAATVMTNADETAVEWLQRSPKAGGISRKVLVPSRGIGLELLALGRRNYNYRMATMDSLVGSDCDQVFR